jgi:K+-transporting ATPase KdpF subunit
MESAAGEADDHRGSVSFSLSDCTRGFDFIQIQCLEELSRCLTSFSSHWSSSSLDSHSGMSVRATGSSGRNTMNWEYLISGIVGVGLLVYLTYALLRPEKF